MNILLTSSILIEFVTRFYLSKQRRESRADTIDNATRISARLLSMVASVLPRPTVSN
jgi:hypothetical protein